jgi:hypothetical protein
MTATTYVCSACGAPWPPGYFGVECSYCGSQNGCRAAPALQPSVPDKVEWTDDDDGADGEVA